MALDKDHGVQCLPMDGMPVLPCECSVEQYDALPPISFNIMKDEAGEKGMIHMPKQAYMKFATDGEQTGCLLMINPWEFAGLGGKEGEEYWVLGAQFLHHYYTVYDFAQKKIGLVESKTSLHNDETSVIHEVEEAKAAGPAASPLGGSK